jgi:rare lipoprotein A (peptidoglycan hydrolase)
MTRSEFRSWRGGRVRPLVAAALCVALVVAGCRSGGRGRVRIGWSERGEASWYGFPFHGQRTASGERYDMY